MLDRVVTCRQRLPTGRCLLRAELPRIPLVAVDQDVEHQPGRASCRRAHCGPGLLRSTSALPEDHLATTSPGEDELRPVLPASVQHQVDRRAATHTRAHRHPLHHLDRVVPVLRRVAVHLRGARPRVAHLQHHTVSAQRQPNQIRQPRIPIRIPGDDEVLHSVHHRVLGPPEPSLTVPGWRPRVVRHLVGIASHGLSHESLDDHGYQRLNHVRRRRRFRDLAGLNGTRWTLDPRLVNSRSGVRFSSRALPALLRSHVRRCVCCSGDRVPERRRFSRVRRRRPGSRSSGPPRRTATTMLPRPGRVSLGSLPSVVSSRRPSQVMTQAKSADQTGPLWRLQSGLARSISNSVRVPDGPDMVSVPTPGRCRQCALGRGARTGTGPDRDPYRGLEQILRFDLLWS